MSSHRREIDRHLRRYQVRGDYKNRPLDLSLRTPDAVSGLCMTHQRRRDLFKAKLPYVTPLLHDRTAQREFPEPEPCEEALQYTEYEQIFLNKGAPITLTEPNPQQLT